MGEMKERERKDSDLSYITITPFFMCIITSSYPTMENESMKVLLKVEDVF